MKRVLTAAVLIPLVLWAVLKAPPVVLIALIAGVVMLVLREYFGIVQAYGFWPFRRFLYLEVVLSFAGLMILYGNPHTNTRTLGLMFLLLSSLSPFVLLMLSMRRENLATSLPSAALSLLAIPYVIFPLASLTMVRFRTPEGGILLLYLFLVVWSGDTFAYYVGKSIGRHKLAPSISPNKSWEGAIASLAGSTALGALFLVHLPAVAAFSRMLHLTPSPLFYVPAPRGIAPLLAISCSALLNIAAQFGDLVESMMKRGAGVKDSGSILPGHGGMLDRIDALLFAAPILWYYEISRIIHF